MWIWNSKKKKPEKNESAENNPIFLYKGEYPPLRKMFLWGWDVDKNPSFVVLYGLHQFKKTHELEETITYTESMIFRGKEGHFPSFEAVEIINRYDYQKRKNSRNMFYKKDIKNAWGYPDTQKAIKEFRVFQENEKVKLPYFEKMPYEKYRKKIEEKRLKWDNFILAENPAVVLDLDIAFASYLDLICAIFSNPNLYLRKKYLKELIQLNPPKELYQYLLRKGSSELISGLFLELSKSNQKILLKEAKNIIESEINWTGKAYADGIKRCASLYLNSLDEAIKEQRINSICKTLPALDLHLLNLQGKKFPKGKILEGKEYCRYANQGLLAEYHGYYSYEERKYKSQRYSERYQKSIYSDGVMLHCNELKNTIQEAEIYGLSEVIGKIAYYLDVPRLTYYFKGNGMGKALQYYRRYLRRILDSYAENEEENYIAAMKVLFTSYTNADYLCKFKGNFQFNYFIKHFLYDDFQEKAPEDWFERQKWMSNDQLLLLKGRYEWKKEIWNRHFDDVIDILKKAKIEVILKAFYYILIDLPDWEKFREKLSYDELMQFILSPYQPVAQLFYETLMERVKQETHFEMSVMLSLMRYASHIGKDIALEYFYKTGGKIEADQLVQFLFLENFTEWQSLFENQFFALKEEKFADFMMALFSQENEKSYIQNNFTDKNKELFFQATGKLNLLEKKEKFFCYFVTLFQSQRKFPEFLEELAEKIIFSFSYFEIKKMLEKIELERDSELLPQKNQLVLNFLKGIKGKKLPSDVEIIDLLETGSSGMIKNFVIMTTERINQLSNRYSTLLILLESNIVSLNELTKVFFEQLSKEEQKKFLTMIIDSPVKRAFLFGLQKMKELYQDEIISQEYFLQMMEHPSLEVKSFASNKALELIQEFGNGNQQLFLYYAKTILFLPNKASAIKKKIYDTLPLFVQKYQSLCNDVEELLLDLGGSNQKIDAERALVALAKIKKGGDFH